MDTLLSYLTSYKYFYIHLYHLILYKAMPPRSYKTKLKISKAMQGRSNFAGQQHSVASKTKISDRRGHYNPIRTKKWFVHNDTGKTFRKTQHPGGLYQRGRVAESLISFKDYLLSSS